MHLACFSEWLHNVDVQLVKQTFVILNMLNKHLMYIFTPILNYWRIDGIE